MLNYLDLKYMMTVVSHITHVQVVHKGETVGYGATYTAGKDMRIATIPIGYADGYPRALSNKGAVLIGEKRCPIVGRICMDQLMKSFLSENRGRKKLKWMSWQNWPVQFIMKFFVG